MTAQKHQGNKCLNIFLSCDYCDKLFDRQSKLTKHMETHVKRLAATQGLFQCDQVSHSQQKYYWCPQNEK